MLLRLQNIAAESVSVQTHNKNNNTVYSPPHGGTTQEPFYVNGSCLLWLRLQLHPFLGSFFYPPILSDVMPCCKI